MTLQQIHPAINAALNLTSFVLLVMGRMAIARGDEALHKKRMLAAFTTSSVFLASYLIRFATTGAHRYPGHGIDKIFYLVMLISHMILAVLLVPFLINALRQALRGNIDKHKKLVAYVWPVWVYVSVTGVLIYLMLYHLAPALHG
ncbi:MAG TPA: DUF420 domain-containing protein [Kofleriaceae bacterium]|jgi:putative membrane protein